MVVGSAATGGLIPGLKMDIREDFMIFFLHKSDPLRWLLSIKNISTNKMCYYLDFAELLLPPISDSVRLECIILVHISHSIAA